jgi:hypothetical protein
VRKERNLKLTSRRISEFRYLPQAQAQASQYEATRYYFDLVVMPCALPVPTHLRPFTRGFDSLVSGVLRILRRVLHRSVVCTAVSWTTLMSKGNSFVKMVGLEEPQMSTHGKGGYKSACITSREP